eukprot:TRINITY_DN11179_c0_g1_i1.p1 TRINITY_DN11179_c0_g1~~TRINITY_DN11179_c0_g1_i1.p1  ORF type:complete len:118 (-),score=23.97 TRINITY_DN11179_c0_g1_i1:21-326(-)
MSLTNESFSSALALFRGGEYEEALRCFIEIETELSSPPLERGDDEVRVESLVHIALCLQKLKRWDEYGVALDRALTIQPNHRQMLMKKSQFELHRKVAKKE